MKRRYIAAVVTFLFAAIAMFPQTNVGWVIFSLVAVANGMLVSVHFVDRLVEALEGVSAGAFQVQSDGDSP